MLTADLVRGRVQDGRLVLMKLDRKRRERAVEFAEALLAVAREKVGSSREELHEAWTAAGGVGGERKLVQGLCKLVEDAATFAEAASEGSADLRRAVFSRAAAARRAEPEGSLRADGFDREAVLAQVAEERGATVAAVEAGLFADLRGAQPLLTVAKETATALVERYEQACVQAVLLRAVRVVAEVECGPLAARTLFRKLKFHRLLHTIERAGDGYRITIDGPYSLFDSVTKYGLELALVLPSLLDAERLELAAEILWGTARRPLRFEHSVRRPAGPEGEGATRLGVEVAEFVAAFRQLSTRWSVAPANTVLELPGMGLVVPDLVFTHPDAARPVHLEVLGYWSRDAVWRRVELVEAGLGDPVLFAVSSRLRVSEAVLAQSESAALYVYKGTMSARAVERKLEALRRG